jgi:aspartate kinase
LIEELRMQRVVVKFGGTSLMNAERVLLAARAVEREFKRGAQIAVVVSAMGHATDELINIARSSTMGRISARELDDIMSMGERTSARIFAATLRSLGVNAISLDPTSENWPIITDSNFGNAEVMVEETKKKIEDEVAPLLERGIVPVVCGFLGKDRLGNTTTTGRGGSDITGFLLGNYLKADEEVIVTDVEGVMSADPNQMKGARLLKEISAEELRDLAKYGARVMHPQAMDFKNPNINAKVIHYKWGDLSARGTVITGPKGDEMKVKIHEKPLSMLTIVGESLQRVPGILVKTVQPLSRREINVFGVSIGPRSFSIYVEEGKSRRALEVLHQVVLKDKLMKSVTSEHHLALLTAESKKFVDTPGMVAGLTSSLATEGVNIVEILSSRASISFLVNWSKREKASKILRKTMQRVGA